MASTCLSAVTAPAAFGGGLHVDLDDGEGLALGDAGAGGFAGGAAEREIGDVDLVLAEQGANAADDARARRGCG